jgi:NDP-sugar pyrophosphorylase family protein
MYFLIPAAGMGKRMGSDRNKLLLTLLEKPLLAWTLLAAEASRQIEWIGKNRIFGIAFTIVTCRCLIHSSSLKLKKWS